MIIPLEGYNFLNVGQFFENNLNEQQIAHAKKVAVVVGVVFLASVTIYTCQQYSYSDDLFISSGNALVECSVVKEAIPNVYAPVSQELTCYRGALENVSKSVTNLFKAVGEIPSKDTSIKILEQAEKLIIQAEEALMPQIGGILSDFTAVGGFGKQLCIAGNDTVGISGAFQELEEYSKALNCLSKSTLQLFKAAFQKLNETTALALLDQEMGKSTRIMSNTIEKIVEGVLPNQ